MNKMYYICPACSKCLFYTMKQGTITKPVYRQICLMCLGTCVMGDFRQYGRNKVHCCHFIVGMFVHMEEHRGKHYTLMEQNKEF